jgi:hypothetical protein
MEKPSVFRQKTLHAYSRNGFQPAVVPASSGGIRHEKAPSKIM